MHFRELPDLHEIGEHALRGTGPRPCARVKKAVAPLNRSSLRNCRSKVESSYSRQSRKILF